MERACVIHPLQPIFDERSKILILGSFPSVKSREQAFYYGHPQNRFWKVLAAVWDEETAVEIAEKREFLLRHGIALWDVIASCEIAGSSDSSIRGARPNDLRALLSAAPIHTIFTNGAKAETLYRRYLQRETGRDCVPLPSTSPANAAYGLPRLICAWSKIREAL